MDHYQRQREQAAAVWNGEGGGGIGWVGEEVSVGSLSLSGATCIGFGSERKENIVDIMSIEREENDNHEWYEDFGHTRHDVISWRAHARVPDFSFFLS